MNPVTRPAPAPTAAIERALAEAARDPDRIGDLLDELSRGLLWVPLPDDDGPVTDGSAVVLPIVTYLGRRIRARVRLREAADRLARRRRGCRAAHRRAGRRAGQADA